MKTGDLLQHSARPGWGLGLVLRVSERKCMLLFEDGVLRSLSQSIAALQQANSAQLKEQSPVQDLLRREAKALQGVAPKLQASLRELLYAQIAAEQGQVRKDLKIGQQLQKDISHELQKHCILTGDPRYKRVIDFAQTSVLADKQKAPKD